MRLNPRRFHTHLLAIAALMASISCSDRSTPTSPRAAPTGPASLAILDGAHGGSQNVFLLPPMVPSPVGKPGYGDPFAANLAVVVKIFDATTKTYLTGGVSAATMNLADQLYQANWDTKSSTPPLVVTDDYRVEILVGSQILAFADINLVSNGSELKTSAGDVIGLVDGRTLPIKVRIEQGWSACLNNANCLSEVVPATVPAANPVTVKTSDNKDWITIGGDPTTGNWNNQGSATIVTIEDVSSQLGGTPAGCAQGITKMVVDGHCMKITTDPPVTIKAGAQVYVCMTLPSYQTDWQMLKYDAPSTRKFMPDPPAGKCPSTTPSIGSLNESSNPLVRFASRLGNAVRSLVTPTVAYAFDLGVGGLFETNDGFSFFAPGRPASMSKVSGDNQIYLIGNALPSPAVVQIANGHHGGGTPVGGAVVTCAVTGGGGSVAASGAATESPTGTYTCPAWTLGAAVGANTLVVTANILDASATGGSATFTATAIQNPTLALKSIVAGSPANPEADGSTYNLTITNRTEYPDALFAPSPSLPACGLNTSASRTWVDIYDAATNGFLGGFCSLGSASNLDGIWFFAPTASTPSSVYVKMTDRLTGKVYQSNVLDLRPTITSLTLASTNVVLDGFPVNYTAVLHNPSGITQHGVLIQGYLRQLPAQRAAGGALVTCPSPPGDLPAGDCTETHIISASNGNGGTGTLVPGAATFVLELRRGTLLLDTKTVAVTLSALPNPALAFKNFDPETDFTTYNLTVTNRSSYPNSLFNASPSLPPCGLNTSASRTWVDIYDGTTNNRLYGFCALGSSNDLDQIWFAVPTNGPQPASVYITMTDRLTGNVYTSNTISLNTTPILALKSIQDTPTARQWNLTVTNRSIYSDQMFVQSPALPPCGANTSASRTWVDIYDASTNAFIYGFCTLGSSADLDQIWFAILTGNPKPASVYIKMTDRLLNRVYQSNSISVP